jgi:N-acetylmuramoyl-L-alanine amidase
VIPLERLRPASADRVRRSPNHNVRPPAVRGIACVVLHATADGGDEEGAEGWMCNPRAVVSAHLHIRRNGTVVRLVPDGRRAWHAGVSSWRGRRDVNDFSLGWELANRNDGEEPYAEAQYAAVARLAAHHVRQGLPLEAFVSHAEVALPPGRKTDPRGFDWERFRGEVRRSL